mgnify:CR=1 FL=1|tara:strand:+ start:301 stop:735 length:435 start_codon:yes stop_codon:yes gene_type:complete
MSNISYQVIPFVFLFVLLILLLAKKEKIPKKKNITLKEENLEEFEGFLEDSEKKLLALKELYKQELINLDVYTRKTEVVANLIVKTIGKDISDLALNKKNEIYNQLRNDIKIKASIVSKEKGKKNIDNLISAVDKRIESGLNYD